jgi:hypothetical protein
MRSITVIRPLAAAVITTSALALAACGGDDPSGESPAASREQMRDAALQYARCMREHGVDMPDPKPGQAGVQLSLPKGTSEAEVDAADKACRKYLEKVKPQQMSEEQQKEFRDAALAQARCMREHGIDMPDPTFGPNGQATIKLGSKNGSGPRIDPESERFKAAQEACKKLMPRPPGGDPDGGPSTQESSP